MWSDDSGWAAPFKRLQWVAIYVLGCLTMQNHGNHITTNPDLQQPSPCVISLLKCLFGCMDCASYTLSVSHELELQWLLQLQTLCCSLNSGHHLRFAHNPIILGCLRRFNQPVIETASMAAGCILIALEH